MARGIILTIELVVAVVAVFIASAAGFAVWRLSMRKVGAVGQVSISLIDGALEQALRTTVNKAIEPFIIAQRDVIAKLDRLLTAHPDDVLKRLGEIRESLLSHIKHIEIVQEAHADQIAHELAYGPEDEETRANAICQRVERYCHAAGMSPPLGFDAAIKTRVTAWAPLWPRPAEPLVLSTQSSEGSQE